MTCVTRLPKNFPNWWRLEDHLGKNAVIVYDSKHYEKEPERVKAIVDAFRAGTWKHKSDRLILAVQASLADNKVQDEIGAQASVLKAEGITSFLMAVRS